MESLSWATISSPERVFASGSSTFAGVISSRSVRVLTCEPFVPRSFRTLVSRVLNCSFPKRLFICSSSTEREFKSVTSKSKSRSRSSRFNRWLRKALSTFSLRLSPTFPPISSRFSKMASNDPYSCIHLAAVFGPTPGTPGRLSLVSPTRAARSRY